MPRAPLPQRLQDPGFTPGVRDRAALFDLLCGQDERLAELAERALARTGAPLVEDAIDRARVAVPPGRARLCRLIARLDGAEAAAFILEAARDTDPKTRRNAVVALGKR